MSQHDRYSAGFLQGATWTEIARTFLLPLVMELIKENPILINIWQHEDDLKFLGVNTPKFLYGFHLSRPFFKSDLHFHVAIKNTYINSFNGIVFLSDTISIFEIKEEDESPSAEELFGLVDRATYEYALIFHERTRQSSLLHHKIDRPRLEEVRPTLQDTIDLWDAPVKAFKASGRRNLLTFRDLPTIPEHKQFDEKQHYTKEQHISHKLHMGQPVPSEELALFEGLTDFYKELDLKLTRLNYSSFTAQDIVDFESYILYAFRATILLSDPITIGTVYRLVVNERVSKKNEPLTDITYLKYPSLDIVKENNIYNRASTVNSTVFYAAQTVDAALREIAPPTGKLISIGVWKPKIQRTFVGYPIIHSDLAAQANPYVREANKSVEQMEETYHPILLKNMHYYIKLLSREYAKKTKCSYEYMISALFSEHIFKVDDPNPTFNFDCILYPSVGNDFRTFNFAIRPSVVDDNFCLEKVIQFEVIESAYEREPILTGNPESISLARIKNYQTTRNITLEGKISW
jgi:hypothetical protein